jgi:hypothetical protein
MHSLVASQALRHTQWLGRTVWAYSPAVADQGEWACETRTPRSGQSLTVCAYKLILMHGASKLMNGLRLGAHIIKKKRKKELIVRPVDHSCWTHTRPWQYKLVRDRPTISSLIIIFILFDMWGGSRVCALCACYGLVMHYLPFSLTICVPDQRSTHGVPTCWWHTEWEKEWMFLAHTLAKRKDWWIQRVKGQAFILMEGTTGG